MPRGASGELAAAVVYSKLPNEGLRVDPPHRERAKASVSTHALAVSRFIHFALFLGLTGPCTKATAYGV